MSGSARFPSTHPRTRQCSSPLAGCRGRRPASSSRLFQVFARAHAAPRSRRSERAGAGGPAGRRVARNRTTGDRRPNGRSGRFRRDVRRSRSRRGRERPWLEAPGGSHGSDRAASPVDETVVDSGTQYVSRWFELAPRRPDWHCLSVRRRGSHVRAAMMLRAEHECWGVVLLAPAGDPLPADDKAFLEFTDGLGGAGCGSARARQASRPIQHYGIAGNRLGTTIAFLTGRRGSSPR